MRPSIWLVLLVLLWFGLTIYAPIQVDAGFNVMSVKESLKGWWNYTKVRTGQAGATAATAVKSMVTKGQELAGQAGNALGELNPIKKVDDRLDRVEAMIQLSGYGWILISMVATAFLMCGFGCCMIGIRLVRGPPLALMDDDEPMHMD